MIGSVAVLPYDNRIMALKGSYVGGRTAELAKCCVEAMLRRQRVGAALVKEALAFCRNKHYATAYLHTHRFLPGAVSFWRRSGFVMRGEMNDELQTVPMVRTIP